MYSVISMKLKSRPKEYADTVFGKILRHDMERIQRKLHQIGTYDIIKIYHVLMIKIILFSVERLFNVGIFSYRYFEIVRLNAVY